MPFDSGRGELVLFGSGLFSVPVRNAVKELQDVAFSQVSCGGSDVMALTEDGDLWLFSLSRDLAMELDSAVPLATADVKLQSPSANVVGRRSRENERSVVVVESSETSYCRSCVQS